MMVLPPLPTNAQGVGFWQLGPEADRLVWDAQMFLIHGCDPALGAPQQEAWVRACVHPLDRAAVLARLRALHAGEADTVDFCFRTWQPKAPRAERWVQLSGRSLALAGQRLCYGMQVDVTPAQRQQGSREYSVFMARMSHELRTPMNAVMGFTRLLEDDLLEPPTARQRDRLARIAQAGDRLLALVDNLLDLARLDIEAEPGPALPLPLSELLREAAAAVAADAERAGVRLLLPHGVQGQAHGDRRRLVQALGHVLLQVVQRCAPGAEVVLQAAVEKAPPGPSGGQPGAQGADRADSAAASAADNLAVVRILDPARPVPGQPSLFEQDVLDAVPEQGLDTEPGTLGDVPLPVADLGLSLALRLVRAVGGRIETQVLQDDADAALATAVATPAPAGAPAGAPATSPLEPAPAPRRLYVLSLPGLPVQPAPGAGPQAAAVPLPAFHVLCVEDNPVNLQLVCEVFALRPKVRLSTAVDGGSGLAQALAEPPDLVLLDLQLPDMSGLDVLRLMRAQPALAGCTVIALSADAMPEHIAAGRAAGFDDYWTKPIQFDRFLVDIDRLAQARIPQRSLAAG